MRKTDIFNHIFLTKSSIKKLYNDPFNLDDEDICNITYDIDNLWEFILQNAEEAGEKNNLSIKLSKMHYKLLSKKIEYPSIGLKVDLPNIYQIAMLYKSGSYIEDEADDIHRLYNYFKDNSLKLKSFNPDNEYDEFIKAYEKRKFFQYWIDLELAPNAEEKTGLSLLKELEKYKNGYPRECIIYSRFEHKVRKSNKPISTDMPYAYSPSQFQDIVVCVIPKKNMAQDTIEKQIKKIICTSYEKFSIDITNPILKEICFD